MFDTVGAFKKQFTPHEGGYLYYPSSKSGGKFVTADEFDSLVDRWQKITGRAGTWKIAGIVFLVILLWTLISQTIALEEWVEQIMFFGGVASIVGWILWFSYAPRRLVKGRPAIVPPRPIASVRREVRAMLNWPMVIIILIISGYLFLGFLSFPERKMSWWAWVIGSGLMFGSYLWIAFKKFTDR